MNAPHRLVRVSIVVEDRAVAARQPFLGGDLLRYQEQVPDQGLVLLGQGVEVGDGLAGHDQDMRRSLGVDVAQGHAEVVLVEDLPRLLAVHDLLEQRLLHHKSSLAVETTTLNCCLALRLLS